MEQPLIYRWQSPTHYYTAALTPDLFGGWTLVTASGSPWGRDGRMRRQPMTSYEEGVRALQRLRHRRRKEGCTLSESGYTEFVRFDPRSLELRSAETNALLRLFEYWKLNQAEQAAVLGIDDKTLETYLDGKPLADDAELLGRARHLLAIHKALRLRFDDNRPQVHGWVKQPCPHMAGVRPIDMMAASLEGLRKVREFLDAAVADIAYACRMPPTVQAASPARPLAHDQ